LVSQVGNDFSFLCVSAETDKVTVFAYVSDAAQTTIGLKANDWVGKAVSVSGGRGGGKPGLAQGSASDVSKLDLLRAEANKFISSSNQLI